ncbi:hypothetical protein METBISCDRAFT_25711 [Metschnikowia bicuspidata]|uniref:N-acetyltransferase domain-containing protein n=1 Tax=Metschnikowia bicuspidata TaxID=27322 RepID=A0A4V1J3L5_9ASCO|nr:hypothetical protein METBISCDRAFT_25711 [Metschnikowia bicuspidata]
MVDYSASIAAPAKCFARAARTLVKAFVEDNLAKLLTNHVHEPALKAKIDFSLYECYLKQHIAKGFFSNMMDAAYDKLWHICDNVGQDKIFHGILPFLHDTAHRIFTTDKNLIGKGVFILVYMGSLAKARGKGNARIIFEYMFENYINLPGKNHVAYLESYSVNNIPIYNKFGFRMYENIVLGTKDVPNAKEGEDYAVVNVMIRGLFGL